MKEFSGEDEEDGGEGLEGGGFLKVERCWRDGDDDGEGGGSVIIFFFFLWLIFFLVYWSCNWIEFLWFDWFKCIIGIYLICEFCILILFFVFYFNFVLIIVFLILGDGLIWSWFVS